MVIWHAERKRKVGGSKYKKFRDKRKRELGRNPIYTKISEKRKIVKVKTHGSNEKIKVLRTNIANVFDLKTKKYQKVKINKVIENKSNRHFARRGIITKGAVIETEIGKAKVTNKPGQEGTINAILIS